MHRTSVAHANPTPVKLKKAIVRTSIRGGSAVGSTLTCACGHVLQWSDPRVHQMQHAKTGLLSHGCTKCNMRKLAFFRASSKCRHQSRSASSPNYKSVGDEPPSPLQCAAARPPMMVLLLGAIEAPHEASSQLARASEVTWKWSVISLLLVFRASLADPARA